jgi:hypothetical protein
MNYMQSDPSAKPPSVKLPTAICVIVMSAISAVIIFSPDQLPPFAGFGITVSVVGVFVAFVARRSVAEDTLRWRIAMNSLIISILIYALFAYIASSREESGLLSFALTVNAFVFFPTALFLPYLLSFLLVGVMRRK